MDRPKSFEELEAARRHFIQQDNVEVFGRSGRPSIYRTLNHGYTTKTYITADQNQKRLEKLIGILGGIINRVKEIPPEFKSKLRSVDISDEPVRADEQENYANWVIHVGDKVAVLTAFGEELFNIDLFVNGRLVWGGKNEDIAELSSHLLDPGSTL